MKIINTKLAQNSEEFTAWTIMKLCFGWLASFREARQYGP
jgi:hypothetical protein